MASFVEIEKPENEKSSGGGKTVITCHFEPLVKKIVFLLTPRELGPFFATGKSRISTKSLKRD